MLAFTIKFYSKMFLDDVASNDYYKSNAPTFEKQLPTRTSQICFAL